MTTLYLFLLWFVVSISASPYENQIEQANQTQTLPYVGPGYQYVDSLNGWMKVHVVPTSFDEAFRRCIREGAQLASPINGNFQKEMQRLIVLHNLDCGVFTGIHDKYTPGHYTSIEGVPLEELKLKWEYTRDCPKKFGKRIIMQHYGSLDTAGPNVPYPYICYKKYTNETQTSQNSVNLGYEKDDRTGSYYKFHREGKTWTEAAMICAEENAHLVVINSAEEAQVLKELFLKYPESDIDGTQKHVTLIGMREFEWGDQKEYLTIHGQTLEEAGYSAWDGKQPDHVEKDLYCGGMFRTGLLDDLWCNKEKIAFICERTPFKFPDHKKDPDYDD